MASGRGGAKATGGEGLKIVIIVFVVSLKLCHSPQTHIPLKCPSFAQGHCTCFGQCSKTFLSVSHGTPGPCPPRRGHRRVSNDDTGTALREDSRWGYSGEPRHLPRRQLVSFPQLGRSPKALSASHLRLFQAEDICPPRAPPAGLCVQNPLSALSPRGPSTP